MSNNLDVYAHLLKLLKTAVKVSTFLLLIIFSHVAHSQPQDPNCPDSDGDGYGWDGSATCFPFGLDPQTNQPAPQPNPQPTTPTNPGAVCIDSDGDGYGWDGSATCFPDGNPPGNTGNPGTTPVNNPTGGNSCPNVDSDAVRASLTKVFVSAGQSNAVGGNSDFDPSVDSANCSLRLYVWDDDARQWQLANLGDSNQQWINNSNRGEQGTKAGSNSNGLYHIGKHYANLFPNQVIGLIPTGTPGMPINYWLQNSFQIVNDIDAKVTRAIGSSRAVDMIWWMQGESDGNNDQNYQTSFDSLMQNIASRNWASFNATRVVASPIARNRGTCEFSNSGDINRFFEGLEGSNNILERCFGGTAGTVPINSNVHLRTCSHSAITNIGWDNTGNNGTRNSGIEQAFFDSPDIVHFNSSAFDEIGRRVVSAFRNNGCD